MQERLLAWRLHSQSPKMWKDKVHDSLPSKTAIMVLCMASMRVYGMEVHIARLSSCYGVQM